MRIKHQTFIGSALTLVLTSSVAFAQSSSKSAQTKLASENLQILSQVPLSSHAQNNATGSSTSTFNGMTVAQTATPSSPTQPGSSSTPSSPTPDTLTPSSPTQPGNSSTPSSPTQPGSSTPSSPTQPGSSSAPSSPTQPGTSSPR